MKSLIKYDKFLAGVIIIFTALSVISSLAHNSPWWDSSVYFGMGKWIFSFGKAGLWEDSRPLALPLMLGLLWKLGLDYVFFGKILMVLFSIGTLILTYSVVSDLFGRKAGFYASLFLSLSPTFLLFSGIVLTEIPSTFLLLLGFYFFINKKYAPAGLMFGLSLMTRFFQILAIIPVVFACFYSFFAGKMRLADLSKFFLFFLLPVLPYIILNTYLYGSPAHPFVLQYFMTQNTGWVFRRPLAFYAINLFKENFLILFSLAGFLGIIAKGNLKKRLFLSMLAVPLIFYTAAAHKEMRILIPVFPFLFGICAEGIISSVNLLRKKNKNRVLFFLLLLFFVQALLQANFKWGSAGSEFAPFRNYIALKNATGGLWISNPSFILSSDKKADELIYYPVYNSTKAMELQKKIRKAGAVLINTCDLVPCPPKDFRCAEETKNLMQALNITLDLIYYNESGKCEYYIFEEKK